MALVEVRDLQKRYRRGQEPVPALRGVTFEVGEGELVALAGPSGSGKSTLLNILGFLDAPDGGSYRFNGVDCVFKDHEQFASLRAGQLGFVFQSFNLVPVLTAVENVELPMTWAPHPISKPQRRERAVRLLTEVGLADRLENRPGELSGGQQQRVAVARALANEPRLVLADEPTANLDTVSAHQVIELMAGLRRTRATSFVIATHDARIFPLMDRVVRMEDGRIAGEERQATPTTAGSRAG